MKSEYSPWRGLLRGIFIAAIYILLSSLTALIVELGEVLVPQLFRDLKHYIICIFCTVASVLVYNSLALAYAYGDKEEIEHFLSREQTEVRFFCELKAVFCTPRRLVELIATNAVIALGAALGAFSFIGGMFNGAMPTAGWFPAVTLTPLCFILTLLAKYEAARYWRKLDLESSIDKLMTSYWLPIRVLLIAAIYPAAMPIAPLLVYAIITVVSVFAKVSALLSVFGTVLAIALLVLLIWGYKVLRGMSRRKRFLKRLRKTAAEYGYKFEGLKNPYRCFVRSKNYCSFALTRGDERYDCIAISTLWYSAPLVFTSPTDAYILHKLGTKNHFFSLTHNIEFYHSGEGRRIIIVDPVPRTVLVSENNAESRVFCSDEIWKITVHDADSFIGCMGRDCLVRKNKL